MVVIIIAAGSYFVVNSNGGKYIQIKTPSEALGFGKYITNPNNVSYEFIDARILTSSNAAPKQYYKLCGSDETSAMSLFTKYLAYKNHDIILDDPTKSPEQKQQRMAEGYGTRHLVDHWKADTHYHYVISTSGNPFWEHVILEDCHYFTPTTEERAIIFGEDYSMSIGTFNYSLKTADSFLSFLQYYYAKDWTFIAENKLHSMSVAEDANTITISFKVALIHSGDWGLPTTYSYHLVTHTLDKKTGNMIVSWKKIGAPTSGHIDGNLLK